VNSWKTAPWPEDSETKSRNVSSCCNDTWFQLISKDNFTDWESLAAEVIAAHLNILSGASSESEIHGDLTSAEDLITVCTWSDSETSEAEELLENLREFNTEKDTEFLENGNSASNENSADSKSDENKANSLLLWILVPTIVVVVVAIFVAALIIGIRKKRQAVISS